MEASEIMGLTLLSIVVLFLTIGTIFCVVDVYKERRKKIEKLSETTNTRLERIEKNAEEMRGQIFDTKADFAYRLTEMDSKCNHICQLITERYEHETPERTEKEQLANEIEDIMKRIGVSKPWWSEKIAMELYEKWWWLKK